MHALSWISKTCKKLRHKIIQPLEIWLTCRTNIFNTEKSTVQLNMYILQQCSITTKAMVCKPQIVIYHEEKGMGHKGEQRKALVEPCKHYSCSSQQKGTSQDKVTYKQSLQPQPSIVLSKGINCIVIQSVKKIFSILQ